MANEIFISYRRTDEPRARLFYNLLKERGVEAWYDAKIAAGEDWRTTTANALDAAPIFVLLLSRTASESGDIAKELAAATHKRKLVVPVRLDDMQLEGMFLYELASRNWIDAYKNTEAKLAELADKLAEVVKSGMTPEAAAQLDVNVAEVAAAKSVAAKNHHGGIKTMGSSLAQMRGAMVQKSGSVALISAAAVALVAAVGAGGLMLKSSAKSKVASAEAAAIADAATLATVIETPAAANVNLASSLSDAAEAAKAAGRSETEIAALADAAEKLAAMAGGTAGAVSMSDDPAAHAQRSAEMNEIALTAARKQIAALAADSVIASVRGDFKTAESESKASGVKLDANLVTAIAEANAAQDKIKAASATAEGTDGAAAIAAVTGAQQAIYTLGVLKPVANDAFIKAKRQSYTTSSASARSIAGEIAQLASAKKPGVFASGDRKDAHKYLVANDAWARSRMAEIDMLAASVTSGDRKAVTKAASQAATAKAELQEALANSKVAAATLAKN